MRMTDSNEKIPTITKKSQDADMSNVNGIYDSKNDPDEWWCPTCNEWVCSGDVTFDETHDPRFGGCGGDVE